jgi:hypothetical protein
LNRIPVLGKTLCRCCANVCATRSTAIRCRLTCELCRPQRGVKGCSAVPYRRPIFDDRSDEIVDGTLLHHIVFFCPATGLGQKPHTCSALVYLLPPSADMLADDRFPRYYESVQLPPLAINQRGMHMSLTRRTALTAIAATSASGDPGATAMNSRRLTGSPRRREREGCREL